MKIVKNKLFVLIVGVAVTLGCFIAVSKISGPKYKDGTYRLEGESFDSAGWKPFMEMTFKNGELVDVVFDYTNVDSTKPNKTEDDAYNDRMLKKIGVNPRIYSKEFAVELLIKQSPDDIDGVSGASASTKEVQIMSKRLFEKAESGDTTPETIKLASHH